MITFLYAQYFCQVVETGSLTQAAKKLGVSQPAVSYAIRELEEELGLPLFKKIGKRLETTNDGKNVYAILSPALKRWDASMKRIENYRVLKNVLNIALPQAAGFMAFPQVLARFADEHPEIKISLQTLGCLEAREAVINGNVDYAIMIYPDFFNLSSLVVEELDCDRIYYLVGKDHEFAKKKSITLKEIASVPFAYFDTDLYIADSVIGEFKRRGLKVDFLISSNQFDTIKDVVRYGKAGAMMYPDSALKRDESLCLIPIEDFANKFHCSIVYAEGSNPSPEMVASIEWAKKIVSERK